jgi:hypothetical protein
MTEFYFYYEFFYSYLTLLMPHHIKVATNLSATDLKIGEEENNPVL